MINKKFKIAIIGAGYVGLDLAIAFSKKYSVICYDVSKSRVNNLNNGIDLNKQYNKKKIVNKNLYFSNDANLIRNLEFYIVTVPTPIDKAKKPDLSMLKCEQTVGKSINKNSMIIENLQLI